MEVNSSELFNQLTSERKPSEEELNEAMSRALLRVLRHGDQFSRTCHDYFGMYRTCEVFENIQSQFATMSQSSFSQLLDSVVQQLIKSEKIELRSDKIRALYGHSLRGIIVGELKWPEVTLFHATSERHLASILENGLRPQGRAWVHLTSQIEYANRIFKNHSFDGHPVLLEVDASRLENDDVTFRQPNSHVWLANLIPAFGIIIREPNGHSEN